VKYLRLIYRLLFFLTYTLYIVMAIRLRATLQGNDLQQAMSIRRRWARRLLTGVGVQVKVTGQPPDFPCIIVANHRSYLDPLVLLRDVYAFPLSKAEVADWPVIGKGAKMSGILFVPLHDQTFRRAKVLVTIGETLRAGHSVIIFPEGTTSDEPTLLPFRNGVFQLAAKYGFSVVPAALHYADPADYWILDEPFLKHAWRRFHMPRIQVAVTYGPTLTGTSDEQLRTQAWNWVWGCVKNRIHDSALDEA
jgi:lyso-ornithine lipid O-acyltransferase